MIERIIDYIEKKNTWLNGKGLCILQERDGVFIPVKKIGNDYKQVENFDKMQEFSYWRVNGSVTTELITDSIRNFYKLVYPCKLVLCKKNEVSFDGLALEVISKLNPVKPEDRKAMGIQSLVFEFASYDIDKTNVIKEEFGELKVNDKFDLVAFNINLVVTVNCLDIC